MYHLQFYNLPKKKVSMIKSMTGYGRSVVNNDLCDIKIEMKSVNSKYMDINVRTSKVVSQFEVEIRSIVKSILKRCKVDIFVDALHKVLKMLK